MKKVTVLTGGINYNQQKYLKDISLHAKDDEYADILPETRIVHPRLKYEHSNSELHKSKEFIVVTFSFEIINSLIFAWLEKEIELTIFYNGFEVMFDDMGYYIETDYNEGFLRETPKFVEKLSLLRLKLLEEG